MKSQAIEEARAERESKKRVLMLVTDAFGGTGGIAQYNRDIIEAIAAHDMIANVTVVPRVISREVDPLPPQVIHLTASTKSKLAFVSTVFTLAKARAFDLVVCGHVNLLPLAVAAAKRVGAPLVLLTYGAEVWQPRGTVARRLISQATAIASISSHTLDRMSSWAEIRSVQQFLLPNAIDLSGYPEQRGNKDATLEKFGMNGSPVLLTLGRMDADERAKGFDEILEALPILAREYPRILYCAAGDGSDRARLMQKAQDLGVTDYTVFPGYIGESDKAALFAASDVYVMPSRLEGFGFVFLEALASGLPVIGSTIDGGREALRDGEWGKLVDPQDRNQLVSAIREVIANPQVPPRRDLEYFSKPQFRKRTHEMLNRVLQINASRSTS